jgi:large subunit ribosomal protein L10
MSVAKENKAQQISELANQLRQAQSIVFSKYWWLKVKEVNELKKQFRAVWVSMKVMKKTLIKRAAKEVFSVDIDDSNLEWQVAVICSNKDLTSWPKLIKQLWRKLKALQLVWWILEWKSLTKSQVIELADMPSHSELVAKLLWTFMAPIQWFYSANKQVLAWFARVLDAHRENLEKS